MTELKYRRMSVEQSEVFKRVAELQNIAYKKLEESKGKDYTSQDLEEIPEWMEARELSKQLFGDFDKDD